MEQSERIGGGVDAASLSAECALALRPEYKGLHHECRQTKDVPLPHSTGLVLMPRCACPCHRQCHGGKQ
ncbi:MAG: hypothetical protein HOY79_02080 [Streptomyces sp.]|nr:hypothetical protein [Streptomyces sp.]